jgi:hypothetical protein
MRQTGPFITYTVMNSGWNESYAPAMDGWWADRQIAWQRELLADNPPAIQSPSESCDDVFRQLPPDSVAGFGGQTVYVGIGGSNDATLKAARMRIQNISEDNRTDSQKTEVNCANARSMSRGSYINESRIIRASFSNESDHWRSGGIYQRVGNVLMPLGGQYPPYAVLAVSVDNLFHSSIVSYTLEVDVQSSNGQIITLPIDDAGMPFRQGSAGQYSIGKIATYCATDTSGPAWHVRPGSEFIDGESLPCIAPKSPSRPN